MDANTLLNALLRASPVVQSVANSRVFPVRIPQSSPTPAVCFMLISRMPQECMKGLRLYDKARVQISIFADDFVTLSTLADGCRAALDGYRGADSTTAIVLEMEHDQFENGYDRYHRIQDYRMNLPAPVAPVYVPIQIPTITHATFIGDLVAVLIPTITNFTAVAA